MIDHPPKVGGPSKAAFAPPKTDAVNPWCVVASSARRRRSVCVCVLRTSGGTGAYSRICCRGRSPDSRRRRREGMHQHHALPSSFSWKREPFSVVLTCTVTGAHRTQSPLAVT
ncbi:hypothetical protein ACLOJK_001292 [Asimina triloba]